MSVGVKFQNSNSITVLGTCISQYCMSVCDISLNLLNIYIQSVKFNESKMLNILATNNLRGFTVV